VKRTVEVAVENREAVNPLVISLEETSEGQNDSDSVNTVLIIGSQIWIDSCCCLL
jgi:hypothetical protein